MIYLSHLFFHAFIFINIYLYSYCFIVSFLAVFAQTDMVWSGSTASTSAVSASGNTHLILDSRRWVFRVFVLGKKCWIQNGILCLWCAEHLPCNMLKTSFTMLDEWLKKTAVIESNGLVFLNSLPRLTFDRHFWWRVMPKTSLIFLLCGTGIFLVLFLAWLVACWKYWRVYVIWKTEYFVCNMVILDWISSLISYCYHTNLK